MRNGISRDAYSFFDAIKKDSSIEIVGIEKTAPSSFAQMFHMAITILTNKPRFYNAEGSPSLIPQLRNFLPSQNGTAIIRIHDLFPLTNPNWFRKLSAKSFQITLNSAVRNNHVFICNSTYTKKIFEENFPTAKLVLLYCTPMRKQHESCKICDYCMSSNFASNKYFCSVGTIEPRKNYTFLIESWENIYSTINKSLVIVGRYGWKSKKIYKKIQKSKSNIIYFENICDFGVNHLISNSEGFISTSFDEGFNFPAVDAALAGIPLFLSDIPVHRELYGESARFFSPHDSLGFQQALKSNFHEPPKISESFLTSVQSFDAKVLQTIYSINLK